jgi:hypothetical protein
MKLWGRSTAVSVAPSSPSKSEGLLELLRASSVSAQRGGPALSMMKTEQVAKLAFVIDATGSRSETWKQAQRIQARMFQAVQRSGRLLANVIYFQGRRTIAAIAEDFTDDVEVLVRGMRSVRCMSGQTQIHDSLQLAHELGATAIILVGDAYEDDGEALELFAKQLRGVPIFAFLEGDDPEAERAFRRLAAVTGGAFAIFGGADLDLGELVTAAATYAVGGASALAQLANQAAGEVLKQLPAPSGAR